MAELTLRILKSGDRVISVNSNNIAIERENGEVEIMPVVIDESGFPSIDTTHTLKITYGSGAAEIKIRVHGIFILISPSLTVINSGAAETEKENEIKTIILKK